MKITIPSPIPRIYKKNGTEIIIPDFDPEEFWKKVQDAWFDSLLYGDNNAEAYRLL